MGTPGTVVSPWVWSAADYLGNTISVSVVFNNTTKALTSATIARDAACLYGHLYIGTGADGTPNTTTHALTVAAGSSKTYTAGQMSQVGLNTINDILALQITAGP